MLSLFKKYKLIVILVIILSTLFVIDRITREKQEPPTPTPVSGKKAVYGELVPGTSTKEQAIEKLGQPVEEKDGGNTLKFTSSAPGKPHEVKLEEGIVKLINETVTLQDEKTIDDIQKEYGEPRYTLFGPLYVAGFHLYVYPENGIAYIGQPESGVLLEVWYFQPTSIEDFNKKFAPDYSSSPPPQTY